MRNLPVKVLTSTEYRSYLVANYSAGEAEIGGYVGGFLHTATRTYTWQMLLKDLVQTRNGAKMELRVLERVHPRPPKLAALHGRWLAEHRRLIVDQQKSIDLIASSKPVTPDQKGKTARIGDRLDERIGADVDAVDRTCSAMAKTLEFSELGYDLVCGTG